MQLQNTACAALSAAIVDTLVGRRTDSALALGATHSLCCEECGKVKLFADSGSFEVVA